MSEFAFQTTSVRQSDPPPPNITLTLDQLWSQFHEELWRFIRPRVRSDAACDDLLQNVFVRVTRAMRRGTEPDEPRAWLHHIARNLIIDSYRSEGRREALESALQDQDLLQQSNIPELGDVNTAELIARLLPGFVALLEEPYRTALELVDLKSLSVPQAADAENVSVSCMKARVRRGRTQLLDALEKCCTFETDGRGAPISCSPRNSAPCDPCR